MDPLKAAEEVLVIPAERFRAAGAFSGFRRHDPDYLAALLDPAHFRFLPRGAAEGDPSFKQLIPYVVLRCGGMLFHYTRGKGGGEARLRALRSVGIGGHINPEDAGGAADAYRAGMLRELAEEVDVRSPYREHYLGFIYDDSVEVGRVHLGVVHLFELETPDVWPRDPALEGGGFAPLAELARDRAAFETWSRLVFDELLRDS